MTKRPVFVLAIVGGLGLAIAATLTITPAPKAVSATIPAISAFAELPNGRGGTNVEAIVYTEEMGFDKERSLAAFEDTVYPLLNAYCSGCHSTERTEASAAQGPIHSDIDVKLAHEYALTRIKHEMVMGIDKNVYVEPAIWTIEWARNFYDYPVTRSN